MAIYEQGHVLGIEARRSKDSPGVTAGPSGMAPGLVVVVAVVGLVLSPWLWCG